MGLRIFFEEVLGAQHHVIHFLLEVHWNDLRLPRSPLSHGDSFGELKPMGQVMPSRVEKMNTWPFILGRE